MNSFTDAWAVICDYCKNKIIDVAYQTWISRIEPVSLDFDKGQTVLLVPNDFHRQTVQRCYMPILDEAFQAVFGRSFDIQLTVPGENKQQEKASPVSVSDDYDYTFDTFIVGSSNKFAHAASLAVATNPSGAYNPLFLYGNSGLGKTHLMHAISNEIKKNHPEMKIIYVKGDDFTNELIEAIGQAKTSEFRQKYRQTDVLLVDDVQFIGGKERTQEEFFHTFNTLYENKKQIVLSSDRPPKDIKTLEDRLRTRFESDLLADVQPPDLETRIAIIQRKAELLDLPVSAEVMEYVAQKLKTNIRQLEGVVKKLKARYLLNGEKPTVAIAAEIISDIINNDVPPEFTVQFVIDEVARTFGVSSEDLRNKKSKRAVINNPRHIAIYVCRELTDLSMEAIGKEFGNRHYSTIVYTVQQIEQKMQTDSKLKESIEDIIKNVRDR